MKRLFCLFFCLICFQFLAGIGFADQVLVFSLKDGSTIQGAIIAHSNHVYSVQTRSIGLVRIHESKISSIHKAGAPAKNIGTGSQVQASGDFGRQTRAMQQQFVANPEIMGIIMSLAEDPVVQEVLADPKIMEAMAAGDMDALAANPKFMNLMNHPKIKIITKKAAQ